MTFADEDSVVLLGQVIGGYELTEVLGSGSFATVYKCSEAHSLSTTPYAIKIITKQHLSQEQLALTRLELDIQSSLPQHPNILNLISSGETDDYVYLVLEYCPNGDLYDVVSATNGRGLPDAKVTKYFAQILDALDVCHKTSVFHRDLKPENLLIADDNVTIKLADFGLSTNDMYSTELGLGTQSYLAPECLDESIDYYLSGPADVFALGIILLNLKFAVRLWRCTDATKDAQWAAFTHSPTAFFSMYYPHFSPALVHFLRRVLEPNPHARASLDEARRLFARITRFEVDTSAACAPSPSSQISKHKPLPIVTVPLAASAALPSVVTPVLANTPLMASSNFNLVLPSVQVGGGGDHHHHADLQRNPSWASDLSDLDFGEMMNYRQCDDEDDDGVVSDEGCNSAETTSSCSSSSSSAGTKPTAAITDSTGNPFAMLDKAKPCAIPAVRALIAAEKAAAAGGAQPLGTSSYVSVKVPQSYQELLLSTSKDWTLLCDDDIDDEDFFDLARKQSSFDIKAATAAPASAAVKAEHVRERRDSLDSAVGQSVNTVTGFSASSAAVAAVKSSALAVTELTCAMQKVAC
ncbi:Serine/threonine protein kinase [Sorochytrium milnesiophthora]